MFGLGITKAIGVVKLPIPGMNRSRCQLRVLITFHSVGSGQSIKTELFSVLNAELVKNRRASNMPDMRFDT